MSRIIIFSAAALLAAQASMPNPFTALMTAAKTHADSHGAVLPALSPVDASLLVTNPKVDIAALHALGIGVVPWTTNDPARMKQIIALHVDILISDRPDLLQQALTEARKSDPTIPANFDRTSRAIAAAAALRPEKYAPRLRSRPRQPHLHHRNRHRRHQR